jgi:hypothetical protein
VTLTLLELLIAAKNYVIRNNNQARKLKNLKKQEIKKDSTEKRARIKSKN